LAKLLVYYIKDGELLMFKIDDYIVYGMTGVCKVVDIANESFIGKEKRKYYILSPVYNDTTVIKTPVENNKIAIRKIISEDEVKSLINDSPNLNSLWIEDEKARNNQFKAILKRGKCDELITLIRSIYSNKGYTESIGKKVHKVDSDIMKEAERLINEEFAVVLNISPDEVRSYIERAVDKH
jgi:RNA polymerase-interacting CarD/CdnL/TRCF family regulator